MTELLVPPNPMSGWQRDDLPNGNSVYTPGSALDIVRDVASAVLCRLVQLPPVTCEACEGAGREIGRAGVFPCDRCDGKGWRP